MELFPNLINDVSLTEITFKTLFIALFIWHMKKTTKFINILEKWLQKKTEQDIGKE